MLVIKGALLQVDLCFWQSKRCFQPAIMCIIRKAELDEQRNFIVNTDEKQTTV